MTGCDRLQRGLPAIDLTAQASVISAINNDLGGECVYAQQVLAYGREGDVLLGISTSGNAKNVLMAMRAARQLGMHTVALTGLGGGKMGEEADLLLDVPEKKPTACRRSISACTISSAPASKRTSLRNKRPGARHDKNIPSGRPGGDAKLSKNPRRAREGRSPLEPSIVPSGVYGGRGAVFVNLIFQSKNRFPAVFAPGNLLDFSKNW